MKKQNVITVVVLMLLMTLFMSFVACKPQENPPTPDKVTITFNSNGGSEVKAITIDKGAKVALPNDPTKEGFSFFGWYEDINGEKIFDDTVGVENDITLFAQWSSNERPPIDPNKLPSGAKLNNLIKDVAAAYGVNTAADMKLDFVAEGFATSGGEKTVYGVAVKGNLALDGDVSLLLTSKKGDVTTTMLGIYAHAGKFYVELGDKAFAINMQELQTIFKAQAINTATPTAGITIDKDLIVGILSLALESKDIQVSTDNYAITVDVAKIWDRLGGLIGGFLLDAQGNAIMNFPGIGDITKENVATWLAENPILVQLNVALKENGVALKIDGSYKTTNMISIDVKDASLTNGKFEITEMAELNEFITNKAATATVVNFANFEFGGQINLLNAAKASYMTFDWKFVMDLDPFEFMSAVNAANASNNPYGWIEQAMLQDNMFHFQLSHACNAACDLDGSFCGSKLTKKATNIIDIFFDPTDTGTAKLYANLGLRGLLSQANIKSLLVDVLKLDPSLASLASSMVAGKFLDNWLVPINLKSITEPMTNKWTTTATNETSPTADAAALDIPSLLKTVNSIVNFAMSAITTDSNSLTVQSVGIFDLMDGLGLGAILDKAGMPYEKVKGLIADVLSGTVDNSKFSAIQLSCTKVAFGNKVLENY
ncbi:MAG: InlB B-repeat-containing protein, partial [Clostridia bacterium]